jgi:serine/threonine protein kinase/tetratricopeptide (TPR) repeat protein
MANEGSGNVANATVHEFNRGQKLFGRYTLIKVLGRGGMGVVWLARDEELEREVALKFLPEIIVHDRSLIGELKRETKRSLELTHKNIVRIHDFVFDQTSACISMEYVDGDTLSNLRAEKEGKVFAPEEIAGWTSQLCDALDYAHNQARIVHRDLKPANLMVNQKGDLKISDFGIARNLGDTMSHITMEQGRSGTLVYMSPQQLEGERGTHLDDIYSLGATVYDLLTGKPPFYSGNIDKQIHERIAPSMTARRKEFNVEPALVPAVWEETVAACLAKDPAKRPQSAGEVANRLQLSLPQTRRLTTRPTRRVKQIAIAAAVVAACLIAIAAWYLTKSKPRSQPAQLANPSLSQVAAIPEKSIAVLPFENLSAEKDDSFFADGIQDDVLTTLGKIKELKVTARPSVMVYRGAAVAGKLREIGQTLRVSHVLQGTVRRSANRVVINVALLDTRDDRQLWSEHYERTLTDAISLQGELAVEIARELRATLTPAEKTIVETKPTNNPAAYDAYLRARAFAGGSPYDKSTVEGAIQSYQEAVKLDPSFALAWAYLSCAQSGYYWNGHDPSPARLAAAKDAADHALALDPNLPETHLALGYYRYFGQRDFTGGLAEFQQAEKGLPNNVDITSATGLIQRRVGHWEEAIVALRRAIELDPRDINTYNNLAETYSALRRFPEALATVDRVLAWEPADAVALYMKARALWATRDLQAVEPLLANLGTDPWHLRGTQALFQRRYAAAIEILSSAVAAKTKRGEPSDDEKLLLGLSQQRAGDVAAARATYQSAVQDLQRELEKVVPGSRNEAGLHAALGPVYAGLGEAAPAIAEGQKAMAMHPTSKDPYEGPEEEESMAAIYALLGDADHAIPILKRLLQIPYGGGDAITPALLRLDPVWDQIRNDPRFQKLCEEKSKP